MLTILHMHRHTLFRLRHLTPQALHNSHISSHILHTLHNPPTVLRLVMVHRLSMVAPATGSLLGMDTHPIQPLARTHLTHNNIRLRAILNKDTKCIPVDCLRRINILRALLLATRSTLVTLRRLSKRRTPLPLTRARLILSRLLSTTRLNRYISPSHNLTATRFLGKTQVPRQRLADTHLEIHGLPQARIPSPALVRKRTVPLPDHTLSIQSKSHRLLSGC